MAFLFITKKAKSTTTTTTTTKSTASKSSISRTTDRIQSPKPFISQSYQKMKLEASPNVKDNINNDSSIDFSKRRRH